MPLPARVRSGAGWGASFNQSSRAFIVSLLLLHAGHIICFETGFCIVVPLFDRSQDAPPALELRLSRFAREGKKDGTSDACPPFVNYLTHTPTFEQSRIMAMYVGIRDHGRSDRGHHRLRGLNGPQLLGFPALLPLASSLVLEFRR